jgi:hypothetical protein
VQVRTVVPIALLAGIGRPLIVDLPIAGRRGCEELFAVVRDQAVNRLAKWSALIRSAAQKIVNAALDVARH